MRGLSDGGRKVGVALRGQQEACSRSWLCSGSHCGGARALTRGHTHRLESDRGVCPHCRLCKMLSLGGLGQGPEASGSRPCRAHGAVLPPSSTRPRLAARLSGAARSHTPSGACPPPCVARRPGCSGRRREVRVGASGSAWSREFGSGAWSLKRVVVEGAGGAGREHSEATDLILSRTCRALYL